MFCIAAPSTHLFVAAEDCFGQAAELLWYMGPSGEDDKRRILQHRDHKKLLGKELFL